MISFESSDGLEDQVIPPTPTAVPLKSEMLPPPDEGYSPGTPVKAGGDDELVPEEPIFPELKLTPKGDIIPDGFHWEGHRIVRNCCGSKRLEGIDSALWQMLGSNERKKIIEWAPMSAIRFYGNGGTIAEAFEFALLADELSLERIDPPKA